MDGAIHELRQAGKSIRAIAAELGMSKSAVHRALKSVPTQNFGLGHSRERHARETLARYWPWVKDQPGGHTSGQEG